MDVHDEIIKNRVIMNFKQEGARTEQVLKSVEAMITFGKFAADTVIVDGYDFTLGAVRRPGQVQGLRREARPRGLVQRLAQGKRSAASTTQSGMPHRPERRSAPAIDVLITLHATGDHVELQASSRTTTTRPPGLLPLKLDPKTLLIM